MQRDRIFEHYQDLDLTYERRPSYWIEPHEGFGEGQVELVELPTGDETNDNIVAFWRPKAPIAAVQTLNYRSRMRAVACADGLSPGGATVNTLPTRAVAFGSSETPGPGTTRVILDFSGGGLPHYMSALQDVEVVASASLGKIVRSSLTTNPAIRGFRAMIDVEAPVGQVTDIRAFLRTGNRALSETWTLSLIHI